MNVAPAKKYWLISLCCFPVFVLAQKQITVSGIIYSKDGSERISQAIITDQNSGVIMMSDELGGFHIEAAKGDTLLFRKNGYADQQQPVIAPEIAVYMQHVVYLPEVTVKDKSDQQELKDVIGTYRSKGLYFDGKPPVWSYLTSPITAFYELFGRDAANERRFISFSKSETEAIAVNKRYTKQLVKRVTGLPDNEAIKFMQQYTPSYQDLEEWNDYDLISHIKRFLVYYLKNRDAKAQNGTQPF